jgi:hypothetical protein
VTTTGGVTVDGHSFQTLVLLPVVTRLTLTLMWVGVALSNVAPYGLTITMLQASIFGSTVSATPSCSRC